jgi:hypothetical protein
MAVPVNQAMFVLDTVTRRLVTIATAGPAAPYDDFLYWKYSGTPPGVGHSVECGKIPRFHSSAYLTVSARAGATFRVAYLGRTGMLDPSANAWVAPVDGIYLTEVMGSSAPETATLVETGMDGSLIDPEAIWDDDENPATPPVGLPVVSLGLEREGLRGSWLVLAAKMGNEEEGWAGVYATQLK